MAPGGAGRYRLQQRWQHLGYHLHVQQLDGQIGGQAGQWVIEMQIDAGAEMAALVNPFGMMVQVLYTGNLATWPQGGGSNSPSTWQFVNNVSCP